MGSAAPRWLDRGAGSLPFVIAACGGGGEIAGRLGGLPGALPTGPWSTPVDGCRVAGFEATPVAAWDWLRAIRAQIDDADVYLRPAEPAPRRLLICDMDMTIVAAETLDEVAALLGLGDRIAAITARAMRGEIDFDSALRERIGLLAGHPESLFAEVAKSLPLNPGALRLLDGARRAGARTILISGGFEQVASVVARQLGFDELYCNRLEIEAGRLTGAVREPIVNAHYKRDKLIERATALGIDLDACCAIGDGANDLPMLEAAGLGIAYRGKPVLREAADCRIDNTDLGSALAFSGMV